MLCRSLKQFTLGLMIAGMTIFPATAGATPLTIVNGDFETQDLTGWTKSSNNRFGATNSLLKTTPASHTWYASARLDTSKPFVNPSSIYQLLDFSSYSSQIDAGLVSVNLHGYGFGETNQDKGMLRLSFLSMTNIIIDTVLSNYAETSKVWTELSIGTTVLPVGTKTLKVELMAMKHPTIGQRTDVGFDNITGNYYVENPNNPPVPPVNNPVPEPGTILLLGTGLIGLAAWRRKK